MRELWDFVRHFAYLLHFVRGVVIALVALVFALAGALMLAEGLTFGESLYTAAITALTVGYGDITPKTVTGRFVSVAIGFVGVVFTGLIVAVATRALARAAEDEQVIRTTRQHRRRAVADASRREERSDPGAE
jgi:voltage-gated potassium channel